jgi:5-methylcytosine-specific restriction endonuclease McrA
MALLWHSYPVDSKQCRTCCETKPLTEFHVRRANRVRAGQPYIYEHISTSCKDCEHQGKTTWRRTDDGKISERRFRQTNEKHRNYPKTEAGRAAIERYKGSIQNLLRQSRADFKARGGAGLVTLTVEDLADLLGRYQMTCAYCRKPVLLHVDVGHRQKLTLDHVRPIDQGGGHTADNLVPACWTCNERKGTLTLRPLPPPAKSASV